MSCCQACLISAKTTVRTPATLTDMGLAVPVVVEIHMLCNVAEAQLMQEKPMRLRSEIMLMMLSAAMPEIFAADAAPVAPARSFVHDSRGQPIVSSSGECWHSSMIARPGAAVAPGCRAPSLPSAAVAAPALPAEQPRRTSAGATDRSSAAVVAGASQATAAASGSGQSTAAYVTDSRGIVVRGSSGDCWRTGTWTPAQATIVGCDGVLARALPVPAAAEPGTAEPAPGATPASPKTPPPAPQTVSPSEGPALAAPAPPDTAKEQAAPSTRPAPVPPAVPAPAAPGPAAAAPGTGPQGSLAADSEPRSEKVTFDTDTFFDFDKSTLKPEGKARLDTLAARLADASVEVVVAVGHADATGPTAYNQRLSERRAKTVVEYLRDKGLPPEKIFSEGKGETQPQASNTTKAGRAKNRRVEVEVVAIRYKK